MSEIRKSGRLLVTGDTHGDQARWIYIERWLQNGDILFQLGDFGYLFESNGNEELFLNDIQDSLEAKDAYFVFVDGNHENHAVLNSLPVETWYGARVHRLRSRIIHLLRGEVLNIRGKKIFGFGGAFSIDRAYRKLNRSYWYEELPGDDDYKNANENLERYGFQVDYILTHTCPLSTAYLLNGTHNATEEIPLQNYLEYVRERTKYSEWFFGHWHIDRRLLRKQSAVFYDIIDMETGKSILDE